MAQRLLESVHSEETAPGDRLPPDRVLASELGVSRATVREALLALELLGVVEIRHGAGVFVTDPTVKSVGTDSDWFTPSITALFEARTAVEPKIARLCAMRMEPEQIMMANDSIARARQIVEDNSEYSTFTEVQLEFHKLLSDCCQNPILAGINRHLMSVEEHPLWALLNQQAVRTQSQRMQQVLEHAQILNHIETREPHEAAAAMLSHLADLGCALVGDNWVP